MIRPCSIKGSGWKIHQCLLWTQVRNVAGGLAYVHLDSPWTLLSRSLTHMACCWLKVSYRSWVEGWIQQPESQGLHCKLSPITGTSKTPGRIPDKALALFFFFWPCHVACGILVPWPGIEPGLSALWMHRVLTGPPGNFQSLSFKTHQIQRAGGPQSYKSSSFSS